MTVWFENVGLGPAFGVAIEMKLEGYEIPETQAKLASLPAGQDKSLPLEIALDQLPHRRIHPFRPTIFGTASTLPASPIRSKRSGR
jgi:hypothetical protein